MNTQTPQELNLSLSVVQYLQRATDRKAYEDIGRVIACLISDTETPPADRIEFANMIESFRAEAKQRKLLNETIEENRRRNREKIKAYRAKKCNVTVTGTVTDTVTGTEKLHEKNVTDDPKKTVPPTPPYKGAHAHTPARVVIDNNNSNINNNIYNGGTVDDTVKQPPKTKKQQAFSKPNLDECKEYAAAANLQMDADHFYDHFESNGWKVGGKTQMKDWKAAMRNWSRNQSTFKKPAPKPSRDDFDMYNPEKNVDWENVDFSYLDQFKEVDELSKKLAQNAKKENNNEQH